MSHITITSPCNEHPLTPHFYIVKLGFTGVYFFLIFVPKHRLWVLLRTASLRRFYRVPRINVLSKKKRKKYLKISSENEHFYSREILLYIAWSCFRNHIHDPGVCLLCFVCCKCSLIFATKAFKLFMTSVWLLNVLFPVGSSSGREDSSKVL